MSAQERTYPAPQVTIGSEHFWEQAAQGRLALKRCRSCGETHYYPRQICPLCFSDQTEWITAAGTGEIYSYSIMRRAPVPYAIAYVTLAEGVTIMSNIVDCDFDDIAIGRPVELAFRETEGGYALPVFKLAG